MVNDQDTPSFFEEPQEREGIDARALPVGYRINEFEIQGVLGSGSFAIVYRAHDHSLNQTRAIKEFLPRGLAARFDNNAITILSKKDEAAYSTGLAGFIEEARLLAGINHPSVVRVYRCIEANRTAYMVMDLCQGETLEQRIERQPEFDEQWIRDFLCSLLGGVEALHAARILHRDIKPSNIFLADGSRPILIDFGSARQLTNDEVQKPMTAMVTYNYSAPEQWDSTGQFPQGPYSDIYSIGATCYEMVVRRKPSASNTRLLRDLLVPASELGKKTYTPRLLATIDKALNIAVKDRYQNARQWLDDLGSSSGRAGATGGRKSWTTLIFSLGVVGAVAAAAYVFLHRSTAPSADVTTTATKTEGSSPGGLIRDCPSCPEMVVVDKGGFQQGANGNAASPDELPRHAVKIAYALAVSRFEITRSQFSEFVNASGYNFGGSPSCDKKLPDGNERSWKMPGFAQRDDEPVVCVSWFDANAYAQWMSQVTGKSYRLLSESEWEYMARAGSDVAVPWGADESKSCEHANLADESFAQRTGAKAAFKCNDQNPYTAPGSTSLRQNRFGVHDTLGNVAEWVADCKTEDYTGAPVDGSAVNSATCQGRVYRGGAFNYAVADVRSSMRESIPPGQRRPFIGLRLARELGPASHAKEETAERK
jgi:formylglycine-generating enzyme required for sulfatase activity